MIEKILEMLETLYDMNEKTKKNAFDEQDWEKFYLFMHRNEGVYFATKIVQEVAKEYGKDTNVRSTGWISTAEMLFPRYGQKVLASVRTDISTHEVIITTYERQEYWHNGIITAWCELPAPYQKGE